MTLLLAHSFPLPVVIFMLLAIAAIGYGLPIAGLSLARKGRWRSAAIVTLIPSVWMIMPVVQMGSMGADEFTFTSVAFLLLAVGVPIILCLVSWIWIIRAFSDRRTEPE